jgi:hypothetical protein
MLILGNRVYTMRVKLITSIFMSHGLGRVYVSVLLQKKWWNFRPVLITGEDLHFVPTGLRYTFFVG